MVAMIKWRCNSCNCEFAEGDATPVLVFSDGNREEPDEYEDHCPDCHSTAIDEIPIHYCYRCEDKIVKDDNELCMECITEDAERAVDAAKGG
jgi:ribosomal protein L37AE/L43A